MSNETITSAELERLTRIAIIRRSLDAARARKDTDGMRWCYRELSKLGA